MGQERTRAGLEAARPRGRRGGRPAVVTSRKLIAALAMREQGDLTMTQVAEELGVSPASLYRRRLSIGDRGQRSPVELGRRCALSARRCWISPRAGA